MSVGIARTYVTTAIHGRTLVTALEPITVCATAADNGRIVGWLADLAPGESHLLSADESATCFWSALTAAQIATAQRPMP